MLVSATLMGLSHLLQPRIWSDFFSRLHERGNFGLVTNGFINAAPAAVIVALHQVWVGPAIVLTIYGWLLLAKSAAGLLVPAAGMRSLAMARRGGAAFRAAGAVLLVVALCCGLQLARIGVA
jgi:hypothetical protein